MTDVNEKIQTWTIHKLRFKPGFKRTKWVQSTFVAAFQVAEKILRPKKYLHKAVALYVEADLFLVFFLNMRTQFMADPLRYQSLSVSFIFVP